MPYFKIEVSEVRHVGCLYYVEADNKDEADEKAAAGDTIHEEELKDYGVMDRHTDTSTLERVKKKDLPEGAFV